MTLGTAYAAVLTAVRQPTVYQATKYLSPTLVVKATRKRFGHKLQPARSRSETLLVTIGQPNYRERLFIKQCQRAGEPFPVKKVLLRHVTGAV